MMIIYNVTCNIEDGVFNDWLEWIEEIYLPEVRNRDFFFDISVNELISSKDLGRTFAIQFKCKSFSILNEYHNIYQNDIEKEHFNRFNSKVVLFSSILQEYKSF